MDDWAKRIDELRRTDVERRAFGARAHGYRLAPPLSEAVIRAVEVERGVRLPEDYRRFLLSVGNGGAGPSYGMLPFDGPGQARLLDGVYPFAHAWNPNLDEPLERQVVDGMGGYASEGWLAGSLALGDLGCGNTAFLVVNGDEPMAGYVCADLRAAGLGLKPIFRCFTDWYEYWLRSALDAKAAQCPAPIDRCALFRALDGYLGSVAARLGLAPGQAIPPDEERRALAEIADGGLVTRVGATDRNFDAGDALRPCHCCQSFLDWLIGRGVLRAEKVADGVPPKSARRLPPSA